MKEEIQDLIDQYKRKVQSCEDLLLEESQKEVVITTREARLVGKKSAYKQIITDLKNLIS